MPNRDILPNPTENYRTSKTPFNDLKYPENNALVSLSPSQLQTLQRYLNHNFSHLRRSPEAMAAAMIEVSGGELGIPIFDLRLVALKEAFKGLIQTKDNSQSSIDSSDITVDSGLDITDIYQQALRKVYTLVELLIPRFCEANDSSRQPKTYRDGRNNSFNRLFFFESLIEARADILEVKCNPSIELLKNRQGFDTIEEGEAFKDLVELLVEFQDSITYTYAALGNLISAGTPDGVDPKYFMNELNTAFASEDHQFLELLGYNLASFIALALTTVLLKNRTPKELATEKLIIGFQGESVDLPYVTHPKEATESLALFDSSEMNHGLAETSGTIPPLVLGQCLSALVYSDFDRLYEITIERGKLYQVFWNTFISKLDTELGIKNPFKFSWIGLTPDEQQAIKMRQISPEDVAEIMSKLTLSTPPWVWESKNGMTNDMIKSHIIATHKALPKPIKATESLAYVPLYSGYSEKAITQMVKKIFYKPNSKSTEYHVVHPVVLETLVTMIPNSEIVLNDDRTLQSLKIDGTKYFNFTDDGIKEIQSGLMEAIYEHSFDGTLISNDAGLSHSQDPLVALLGGSGGLSQAGVTPAIKPVRNIDAI
ncbi:MAG: hypothetical protein H7230_02485 [Candidatus Parcubacteria bacterium]|nr:hypothetical protein [Candidatus Paceibacterota bacterium]